MSDINSLAIGLGLALALSFLISQIAARIVRAGFSSASGESPAGFRDPIQRRPIRIVRAVVFLVTISTITPPALEIMGVDLKFGVPLDGVTSWLFQEGLRVGLIATLAYFTIRMTAVGISHFEQLVSDRTKDSPEQLEFAERLHTISGLAKNAVNVLVVSAAVLMVLQEFGVDITPLLTAAGIGGLAIGFGAQNLVRDVISGFFLILEDQIHVGDVVSVDGTAGLVEAVKLRTIVLRDLSGTVHVVPNGSINTLSNMTKDFSYAVLDVGVAYKEDTDRVVDVLQQVGQTLENDDLFSPSILAHLEVLGVNEFGDSAVSIKIRIKTLPLKQWMIERELRRRIKKTFDAKGIEIPFPHISVYYGEASKPFLTQPLTQEEANRIAEQQAAAASEDRPSQHTSATLDADSGGDSDVG